ncbi:MAG: hypothetical protein JST26_17520 [Bacteroidetes bacterium]|nr:hypothetical protein [Bacteroidota bacterium]
MKFISTLALLLLLSLKGFSQFHNDDVKKLKDQELLVALMDTTDKKQLEDRSFNNSLMFAMKNNWTYCKYKFITIDDIKAVAKSDPDTYILIPQEATIEVQRSHGNFSTYHYAHTYNLAIAKASDVKIKKEKNYTNFSVPRERVILQSMKNGDDELSVFMSVDDLNYYCARYGAEKEERKAIDDARRPKDNTLLQKKTLYIDKAVLAEGVTEADIKENYTYAYKLTTSDEILQAIKQKKDDVAFLDIAPSGVSKAGLLFVKSCADLSTILYTDCNVDKGIDKKKIKDLVILANRTKK